MGIKDKAPAVREFKAVLWQQDTQNKSTATQWQILVQTVERKNNPLEENQEEKE